jgi:glycosyltransferase involved in cell wall biosynthesis
MACSPVGWLRSAQRGRYESRAADAAHDLARSFSSNPTTNPSPATNGSEPDLASRQESTAALRVCMVTTFFPPDHFGGDAIHVYQLSRALVARGHSVDVVYNRDAHRLLSRGQPASGQGEMPPIPGVRVHALESSPALLEPLLMQQTGRPVRHRARLQEILATGGTPGGEPYDVIHFHNVSLMGAPAVLEFGGGPKTLRLYTIHEHWLVCPMHVLWRYGREPCETRSCLRCQVRGARPPQWWRFTSALSRSLAKIDAFIAPSEFTARKHAELGLTLPIRRLPHFTPDVSSREPGADASPAYFLFAGRLEPEKGALSLVQAFRRYRDAELWIAGEGSERAALEAASADLPHVRLLGRLAPDVLTDYYRRAIGVIVPSLCYEVFGLTAAEAFAAGTPAIVRDRGALPELVELTGGGLRYRSEDELIDAMHRLRSDSALRDQLGQKARRAQQELLSERAYVDGYEALVAELAARRGAGDPTPAQGPQ